MRRSDLGALLGAAGQPLIKRAARRLASYRERQPQRGAEVVALAARAAGLPVDDLLARLTATPEREELLLRTLRVAQDSAVLGRLVALSKALAAGAIATRPDQVQRETVFARALGELDGPHLAALTCFSRTSNELGLGTGDPDFDVVPQVLNEWQLKMAMPEFDEVLSSLLAVLQAQGLIAARPGGGGAVLGGGGSSPRTWELTELGRAFLDRMREVGDLLAS